MIDHHARRRRPRPTGLVLGALGMLWTGTAGAQSVYDGDTQRLTLSGGFYSAPYTWVADFNGDGVDDIATAGNNTLRILESRGGDHWATVDYDTGSGNYGDPAYVRIGDVDGDGKADIVGRDGDRVVVRRAHTRFRMTHMDVRDGAELGSGRGWGSGARTFLADMDGDGRDDIVSIAGSQIHIQYARVHVDSYFEGATRTVRDRWGGVGYTWLGDFDGDGRIDIASANAGQIYLYFNRGASMTEATWSVPSNWGAPQSTFCGDFDGNGKADIVSVQSDFVVANLSDGSRFTQRRTAIPRTDGDAVRLGDFDGDGRPDIAAPDGPRVHVYGYANGEVRRTAEWGTSVTWGDTAWTWAGRFGGDGVWDLATARYTQIDVVRRGDLVATVGGSTGPDLGLEVPDYDGPPVHVPESTLQPQLAGGFDNPTYAWKADFNGDGVDDVAQARDAKLTILQSAGDDVWTKVEYDTGSADWGDPAYILVADFDGDGKADIVGRRGDRIVVRRPRLQFRAVEMQTTAGWGAGAMTHAADVDGDGRADIISIAPSTVHIHLARIHVNSYFEGQRRPVTDRWGSAGYTWVADFDGDGRPDIASAIGGDIRLRLDRGGSYQEAGWSVPNNWGADHSTVVGDFDGNGKADIATMTNGWLYTNLSTGRGFSQQRTRAKPCNGAYVRVGDFDGDGKDDIASPQEANAWIYALRGGRMALAEVWLVPERWWGELPWLWAGRFGGDGTAELATAVYDRVRILRRRAADPNPDGRLISFVGSETRYTAAAFERHLADNGRTLVEPVNGAIAALRAGQCAIAYAGADQGDRSADFGALVCVVQLADGVTVEMNAVYGGCDFAQRGAGGTCEVGVFASSLTVDLPAPLGATSFSVKGPNAGVCSEVSTERYCMNWGADLVSTSVEAKDALGNGVGASVAVGVGYGYSAGYDDGVLSVDMELKVIAGGSITFDLAVENDVKAVIGLGKMAYARVGHEIVAAMPGVLRFTPVGFDDVADATGRMVVAVADGAEMTTRYVSAAGGALAGLGRALSGAWTNPISGALDAIKFW